VDRRAFRTTDDLPSRSNGANVSNDLDYNLAAHLREMADNGGVRNSGDVMAHRQKRP
jgi:hypothetical protein